VEERVFVIQLEASGEVTPARPADADQSDGDITEPEGAAEPEEAEQ